MLVCALLVGCSTLQIPTPTPTRVLSGPTLAPTQEAIPMPPSEVPGSFVDPFGSSDPTAAALPNDLELPPLAVDTLNGAKTVTITLTDLQLTGTLHDTVPVRSPGVLLLGAGDANWGILPTQLEANGYVTLVVNLPAEATLQSSIELLDSFLELAQGDESPLDPARIAVIGERSGADIALRTCAADLRCDALGMLSPQDATGSVITMQQFSPRVSLIAASQDDTVSFGLSQNLASSQATALFQPFTSAGSGADMLINRPDFADLIVDWLNRSL